MSHNKPWFANAATHPLRYLLLPLAWLLIISILHYSLNFEHSDRTMIRIGYMPVITNFSAPILDHATTNTNGIRFKAIKYSSFSEMAESLRNKQIDAAFIIAPLSIVLRQQGVDVKVVLIGNRHESSFVTRRELDIKDFSQLDGKTIAVPMRFSGHNLGALSLIKQYHMDDKINIVEMNPPDMASALAAGSLDAYFVGEPFAAKTLRSGHADLLFRAEDIWPGFICNLVLVNQSFIQNHPNRARLFVESAARANLWISKNKAEAAAIASRYWNTDPELVLYAMDTPEDRVVYDQYIPKSSELQKIANMMQEFGLADDNSIDGLVYDHFATNVSLENIESINTLIPK